MNEIAIASIPIQEWEQPYDEAKAFQNGSIFPELNKPFFVEEKMEKKEVKPLDAQEAKLLEIQQVTFFLIDLQLFLDTHPDHKEGKRMKQQLQQRRKELKEKFAQEYYPLTTDCQGEQEEEIAPWGGGKKHVAL